MTTTVSQCGHDFTETIQFIHNGAPCILADHNGDPCEACVELAQLEAQVGELYSELKDLHRRHSILTLKLHKCWIDKLPNEIMADIILRVCLPAIYPVCSWDRDTSVRGPQPLHPLTLAKVSRRWRDLVFSITELWAAIPIEVSEPNMPLINHHLRLSGPTSPLSVTLFTIPGKAFDDDAVFNAMAFINENSYRIAYLCLSGTDDFFRPLTSGSWICPDAAPILEELHIHQLEELHFHRLEQIHIHRNDFGFQSSSNFNLCKNAPRPQRVYIHGYCPPRIHLDWSHVSNLRLRCRDLPPLEVINILSKAKSLLEFECDTTILDITMTQLSTVIPIIHNSIRTARISSADSQREVFLNTTMCSLESLKIEHFDSPQKHVFLTFLQQLSHQLTSVELSFDYRPAGEELIDIFRNTSVLQTLELHFGDSLTTGDARLLPFPKYLSLPVSQVVDPARDAILLPHLEKLHLSGNISVRYSPYLKIMENRCATINLLGGGQVRALDELMIKPRLDHTRQIQMPVTQDELRRILDLRKAKKTVLISFSTTFSDKQVDFVEQAIPLYES